VTAVSTWEERMSQRAKARMAAEEAKQRAVLVAEGLANPYPDIPEVLAGGLPDGAEDVPRTWCTTCGLADAPEPGPFDREASPACPRCGSWWRWYGRIADRDGTATSPPTGECTDCFEWRRYPGGQAHFGWGWWMICRSISAYEEEERLCKFGHDHHDGEVWLA
jgi:hypothetical protein